MSAPCVPAAALAACLVAAAGGHSILVTSLSVSTSQNLLMYRIADYLGERGHKAVILKADVFPSARSPPVAHVSAELKYRVIGDDAVLSAFDARHAKSAWANESAPVMERIAAARASYALLRSITDGCRRFMSGNDFAKLRRTKFDAAVLHFGDFCGFGLAHMIGIKTTVIVSTSFMLDHVVRYAGVPVDASYVPGFVAQTDEMTFVERARNVLATTLVPAAFSYVESLYDHMFREANGADFPSIAELGRSASLYFVNADMNFEYPRPLGHNVRYIGGLHMETPAPLDAKWTGVVEGSREKGIVLFSLGTVANTALMPVAWKQVWLDAFAQFADYTFVIKLDAPLPDRLPDNVLLADWLPQKDILAHAKTKLFITHGGYNSITEATATGVPLICMPLFGDQPANAQRILRARVGVTLDKDDMSVGRITAAIATVLGDPGYGERARRLARMIKQQPLAPLAEALDWIEFAAEFGPLEHMRLAGRNMAFVRRFNVDVYVAFAAVLLVAATVLLYCARCSVALCMAMCRGKAKAE